MLVKTRPAGDSEKQAIREQDESKPYHIRVLIALLFTACALMMELPGSIIKHPAEVPAHEEGGGRGSRVNTHVDVSI